MEGNFEIGRGMRNILIYKDHGVSAKSHEETLNMCCRLNAQSNYRKYHIKTVTAQVLNQEKWEKKNTILIIPGGRANPYYEALQGSGHQKIKDFVALGGTYLGICAGAYYGASHIIFEKGNPEYEIITSNCLSLYTGTAEGPAYDLGLFRYHSEEGARVASIETNLHIFPAYFNGGCWFHSHQQDSNTNIIARYADIKEKPAAVVICHYGKGVVCLSGVHFEYFLHDEQQSHRDRFIQQLEIFC